jgi:hypothetical protein
MCCTLHWIYTFLLKSAFRKDAALKAWTDDNAIYVAAMLDMFVDVEYKPWQQMILILYFSDLPHIM